MSERTGMYIRRTHTRNSATGERYHPPRLVRSTRVGGQVRQITLLNLGRHFAVPPADWPTLCVRLEELLSGQGVLRKVEITAELEHTAPRLGAQLLARQPVATPAPSPIPDAAPRPAAPAEVDTLAVDTLILRRPRSVGVESVGLWAMAQLAFAPLLETLGLNGPERLAILGAIIARMAAPGSERATRRWLVDASGLGELLDVDFETINLMRFYRASDALLRHRAIIEQTLFARVSAFFGLDWTVTRYALTNIFFEGEAAANPQAKRGHAKEKRRDCPLVTLGLVLDGSGFVRRAAVCDGNVVEGTTLAGMLAGLGAPGGALVVMDRGMATEENLVGLRAQGYCYLVVSRERQRQCDADAATSIQSAGGDPIAVQRVLDAAGGEVRLYGYSECRAHKEEGIAERFARASRRPCRRCTRAWRARAPPRAWPSGGSASGD